MEIEKKQQMMPIIVALFVGSLGGFLLGTSNKDEVGRLGRMIEDPEVPLVALIMDSQGQIKITRPDGSEVLSCSDKRRFEPCRAEFAKDEDGYIIVRDRKTREKLPLIYGNREINWLAYEGSHCPLIGGLGKLWDPCH